MIKYRAQEISMPIYEYQCNECNNVFEQLTTTQLSKEQVTCKKCKSENVKKLLSAGNFKLSSGSSNAFPSATTGGCGNNSGFS